LEVLEDRRLLSSLVVGDFNGDQRLDMAVMNENGLTVLLNQGNGAFLAVPVLGLTDVGEGPASLVAGDFNGDGTLDLAVATPAADRPGGGCITVLLGLGNGNFQQAFHLDIHGIPSALVAGDFNGDGTLDLAVATIAGDRPGGGCITVLSGEGNGSFVQTFDIPVNGRPTSLVTGDFNGDGILDLAVATAEDRPGGGGCIVVLQGLGSQEGGGFQQAFDIHVNGRPTSLVAGDFNGDGILDLAVATVEVGDRPGGGCIIALLGQVNGGFQQAFDIHVDGRPTSLVVGDFNGDGILDLAVATVEDRPGGGCITVLLGQGDGSFQQAFDIHVHGHPSALVAGDFNGDGKLDLAVANDESVTILIGNGDGSFVSGPNLSLPETGDDSSSESGGDIQEGLATSDDSWSSLSQQSVLEL
jgi:hypothetical protein